MTTEKKARLLGASIFALVGGLAVYETAMSLVQHEQNHAFFWGITTIASLAAVGLLSFGKLNTNGPRNNRLVM